MVERGEDQVATAFDEGDELIGVLDVDSPILDRFDPVDQTGLEAIARVFLASLRSGQLASAA